MTSAGPSPSGPPSRWTRYAGVAGTILLLGMLLMLARPSRIDRREVLGRYSRDYVAMMAVVGAAGIFLLGGVIRPGSRWGRWAGRVLKEGLGAGVMIVVVFFIGEGVCRLAERPLARFTGGPMLTKGYEKLVHLNSRGLRDPERPLERPAGTWRLVVLGDSFMFGQGVPDDSSCVRHLERALNATGERRVEVINTSHVGYNTIAERAVLDTIGLRFHPDAVLIGYALNDPEETYLNYPELLPGPLAAALEWSQLYYLVRATAFRVMVATGMAPDYPHYIHQIFDTSRPSWQVHVAAVRGVAHDAKAAGVPLVAVVWPFADRSQGFTPYLFAREQALAVQTWRDAGVPVLDLYPVFANDSYVDFALSPEDSHPNVSAQRRAADAILTFLAEAGMAPPRTP